VILGGVLRSVCSSAAAAMTRGARDTLRFGSLLTEQKHQLADLRQQLQFARRRHGDAPGCRERTRHRLDALGKRLTEMADIDSREFNFAGDPPAAARKAIVRG